MNDDEWLTGEELSALTKGEISIENLAQRRYRGLPPAFYKPTPKVVLYKRSDVLEWLNGSRQTSTAEVA
jgi:hypothetical protein